MISKPEVDRGNSLLLVSEDRVDGFSIVADDRHNTTLLRWDKRVAWFSAAVTGETMRAFLELVKDCEGSAEGDNASVVKTEQAAE